jgi:hypothetical protein
VKDCDPATGLPDSDEGYDDEYMVSTTAAGGTLKVVDG